jgi:two-component system, NtrC family, nitrogen regulation response regulator GlnG
MKPVWIVDDDASIRWVLEKALSRAQLPCRLFETSQEVMRALQEETPQVLVSDIRMPGESGLALLEQVKARLPELPVIIMTGFSDLDSAVSAFQGGAFEYLPKPFDVEEATALIRRACSESQGQESTATISSRNPSLDMLGHAPAMQEVFRAIGRLSQSAATTLITGESGTGKELVAGALHRHSPRAQMPFVALNTAAIPHDLLESELFGHERGAFTGAQSLRRGRFEQAEGGTLFLDEIGDMSLDLQTRLLRVLSDGHYYRVGGHQPLKANVRVIAATHQNLEKRVRDGQFREDLFHRLNVIRLRLPPLRERREDIADLAIHFLAKSAKTLGVESKVLAPSALDAMMAYSFPGNVRELENLCHRLTVMAPSQHVELNDLPPELLEPYGLRPSQAGSLLARTEQGVQSAEASGHLGAEPVNALDPTRRAHLADWRGLLKQEIEKSLRKTSRSGSSAVDPSASFEHWSKEFETLIYGTALEITRGRRIEAAQILGVGRNTITRKIAELGLES